MISEDHVDAFIGPSLTATDAAVAPLANQAKVPMIAMAPYEYDPQKQPYTFNDAQPLSLMVAAVFKYMQQHGVKNIGYIGFSDGWGDQVLAATRQAAGSDGISILTDERYARTDTTCEAQALKLISAHPQAVMMGNSATPAALPVVALRHRGYKGTIYGNHGVVSPAFIKVGGAAVEGVIAVTSPVVVTDQLPDANPVKPVAAAFVKDYAAKFGAQGVSPFAGYSYDAMLLLKAAIPEALKAGKPGTEAFRVALRDALEKTHELVGVSGVYTMSPTDHNGQDARSADAGRSEGRRLEGNQVDPSLGPHGLVHLLRAVAGWRDDGRDLSAARHRAADRILSHARHLRSARRSAGVRRADCRQPSVGPRARHAVVARRHVRTRPACLAATRRLARRDRLGRLSARIDAGHACCLRRFSNPLSRSCSHWRSSRRWAR